MNCFSGMAGEDQCDIDKSSRQAQALDSSYCHVVGEGYRFPRWHAPS